ncbi:MAG: hypothetical protein SNJ33_07910 [Rikenellaceae bacterium]
MNNSNKKVSVVDNGELILQFRNKSVVSIGFKRKFSKNSFKKPLGNGSTIRLSLKQRSRENYSSFISRVKQVTKLYTLYAVDISQIKTYGLSDKLVRGRVYNKIAEDSFCGVVNLKSDVALNLASDIWTRESMSREELLSIIDEMREQQCENIENMRILKDREPQEGEVNDLFDMLNPESNE